MKIIIVDDENLAVLGLIKTLEKLPHADQYEVHSYMNPKEGLEHILSDRPDIVFLDIEMPGITGLDIAERLTKSSDWIPGIIFVTAYPQFSLNAWDLDAVDYILKPYKPEKIERALEKALQYRIGRQAAQTGRPFIRCFPGFDVLIDGKPVEFASRRSKELLAFLVHYKGSQITTEKIAFEMMEDADEDAGRNHVRVLLTRLKQTLAKYGISEVLDARHGTYGVNIQAFDCDYYRYLEGNRELFQGRYLEDYSWAETEAALLCRKENIYL